MKPSADENAFIDRPAARYVAGGIAGLMVLLLLVINREALFGGSAQVEVEAANPDYVACLEERLGHVDGMVADGVITSVQAEDFKARATALCAGQFPPEG